MRSWNKIEMFIAVCALVSSMIAIYVGWDQSRVMRAQQHGSVFPVLQIEGYSLNNPTYSNLGLRVRNSGVGPALVESVVLEVDGETVDNFNSPINSLPNTYEINALSTLTGRALAPGEQVTAIELVWRREDVPLEQMANFAIQTQAWQLNICYCSVFGKCWKTRGFGNVRAESVPSCPRSEEDIFSAFATASRTRDTSQTVAPAQPAVTD